MSLRTFEVTLISGPIRLVRRIAAHSAITATRIALDMMPALGTAEGINAPLAVICKPALSPVEGPTPAIEPLITEEQQPCAA